MPELQELYINDNAYPIPDLISEWINVSSSKLVAFTAFSDQDFTITVDYSVSSAFAIIDSIVYIVVGGNTKEVFLPVKTRFMRFTVSVVANPCILRTQGFFWVNGDISLQHLEQTGAGIQLFSEPNLLKTISAGVNIVLNDTGDNIEVSNVGGGGGPYQQVSDDITTIGASANAIVSGTGNVLNALSLNSLIGGCNTCSFTNSQTNESAFIASNTCTTGRGVNCLIDSSINCNIGGAGGAGTFTRSQISSSDNCHFSGSGDIRSIISSNACTVHNSANSSIIACDNCIVGTPTGSQFRNDFLLGSYGCSINQQNAGVEGMESHNGIIGSKNCSFISNRSGLGNSIISSVSSSFGSSDTLYYNTIIASSSGLISDSIANSFLIGGSTNVLNGFDATYKILNSGVVGGISNSIVTSSTRNSENNLIVGGSNNLIQSSVNGGPDSNNIIIGSQNATINNFSNVTMICSGATPISASASNRLIVKKPGGTYIYSNDAATSGMFMAANSSSWSMVSDINKKENVTLLNDTETMQKVKQIPVYRYNYVGVSSEYTNIGPIAQDFHTHFASENIQTPVINPESGEQSLDEFGNPIFESKPAKDPLSIENNDLIGILMSCVRNLNARVEYLESLNI